jgi:hypothetical protein
VLHPSDWPAGDARLLGAPAVHRQLVAWLTAAGIRPNLPPDGVLDNGS